MCPKALTLKLVHRCQFPYRRQPTTGSLCPVSPLLALMEFRMGRHPSVCPCSASHPCPEWGTPELPTGPLLPALTPASTLICMHASIHPSTHPWERHEAGTVCPGLGAGASLSQRLRVRALELAESLERSVNEARARSANESIQRRSRRGHSEKQPTSRPAGTVVRSILCGLCGQPGRVQGDLGQVA